MAIHPFNGIELFSGTGMLGEGFRAGIDYLGIPYRTVCHVEREAHAASVLVARIQEGSLDSAPIWPDVTTFDARAWRGKVDCVIAGFPCQDLSVAGRRAGLDGKRSGLFFEVIRIADDSDAWLMLLENVGGIATATASVVDAEEGELDERAASRVVGELADCGWNAEWITLSASDVGASHGRARWFCIAWRMGNSEHDGRNATEIGSGATQGNDSNATGKISTGKPARSSGADGQVGNAGLQHQQLQQRSIRTEHQGANKELDNPISFGRGARRMPDGEHERDIATAAGEIVVVNTTSAGFKESRLGGERQLPAQTGTGLHDRPELASAQLADTISLRGEAWISGQNTRDERNAGIAIDSSDVDELAYAYIPRSQRHKQSATHEPDGRTDGRSKNHADQLPNFIMMNFLHPAQTTQDGQTSSEDTHTSRQHLNPLFAAWLMGWPSTWVIAEPHASSALETELWRSKLRSQLSYLLDEQDC